MRRELPAIAAVLFLALPGLAGAVEPSRPTLFIALDAVPYWVLERLTDPELGEAALFQDLEGPTAMVSSFPSSTSVALPGMLEKLGLARSPGYEARFFHWQDRRVRGGGPLSYHRYSFPWHDFFDFEKHGPIGSAVASLRPVKASVQRLERAVDAFLHSEEQTFLVYIGATDTAAHLRSPSSLERVLRELDRILRDARRQHPDRPFHVVIFSDHGIAGGEPLENVWRPVRKVLKQAGFRYSRRLRRPSQVALTPFGLVSSFELYTWEGREAEVAELVARVEGVDLCVYRAGKGWVVEGVDGRARIDRRSQSGGDLSCYREISGDPLGYRPVLAELRRRTGDWQQNCFGDQQWFESTFESSYPDALYRLTESFTLVENPASVVCSVGAGHMFGAVKTEVAARLVKGRLRWTHGALEREATLGFVMSDLPGWRAPRAVRFDRSMEPFVPGAELAAGEEPTLEPGRVVATPPQWCLSAGGVKPIR